MLAVWKNLAHVVNEVLSHTVGAILIITILFGADRLIGIIPELDKLAWLRGTPYLFTVHDLMSYADLSTILAFLGIGFVRIVQGMLK